MSTLKAHHVLSSSGLAGFIGYMALFYTILVIEQTILSYGSYVEQEIHAMN